MDSFLGRRRPYERSSRYRNRGPIDGQTVRARQGQSHKKRRETDRLTDRTRHGLLTPCRGVSLFSRRLRNPRQHTANRNTPLRRHDACLPVARFRLTASGPRRVSYLQLRMRVSTLARRATWLATHWSVLHAVRLTCAGSRASREWG